jgi:hypothetical protein
MASPFDVAATPSRDPATIRVEQAACSIGSRRSQHLASGGLRGASRKPTERSLSNLRMSRELTLKTAAREYVWLYDYRHGVSLGEIASRDRISVQRIAFGVGRARAQEKGSTCDGVIDITSRVATGPRLVPLFPIGHYTPHSECPHKEPIEPGSSLCCMVCHKSGLDQHPIFQRDARHDPSHEPTPTSGQVPEDSSPKKGETRKQRRHRQFSLDSD